MKTFLKWGGLTLLVLLVVGFGAFLYNIPPVLLIAPETFQANVAKAAPPVDHIADPATRAARTLGWASISLSTSSARVSCRWMWPRFTRSVMVRRMKS